MNLAMQMEIKETIFHEKCKDFYNDWIKKAAGDREKIGLALSYDMEWNQCSSVHRYDSISGHAFIISVYTRRIIGSVVSSKTCSICDARSRKK